MSALNEFVCLFIRMIVEGSKQYFEFIFDSVRSFLKDMKSFYQFTHMKAAIHLSYHALITNKWNFDNFRDPIIAPLWFSV